MNYSAIDFADPNTFSLMLHDENKTAFLTNNDMPHSFFSHSYGVINRNRDFARLNTDFCM